MAEQESARFESARPLFEVFGRELAEVLVLIEYLTGRPEGLQWQSAPVQTSAASSDDLSPIAKIDRDIQTPTSLLHRVSALKNLLSLPYYESYWDWPSELAFLSRAKSILSELAAPATSLSLAFTSMVLGDSPSYRLRAPDHGYGHDISIAEAAFPSLVPEAHRLSASIRRRVPTIIVLLVLVLASIIGLAHADLDLPGYSFQTIKGLANTALESGIVPALLGALGALASILRRFQLLANARLLDPGLRDKNRVDTFLGFIAGLAVGLLQVGLAKDMLFVPVLFYAAAFLAGYSSEIFFSLVDVVILRFSQLPVFQERSSQFNKVMKTQTSIAQTVTQIRGQIEQIQGNVTLDPFDGAILVTVTDPGSSPIKYTEHLLADEFSDTQIKLTAPDLVQGKEYELHVSIDKQVTSARNAGFERIVTGKGPQTAAVSFVVGVNSRDVRFTPKDETLTLEPTTSSASFLSRFVAPDFLGRCDIFAEVYQKNRLVAALALPVVIAKEK